MAVIYTEEDFIDEGREIRVGKFLEHRKLNMHARGQYDHGQLPHNLA